MTTEKIDSNIPINQSPFSHVPNFNSMPQNISLDNTSIEEITQKINSLLQGNNLAELSLYLKKVKDKIPQKIFSSYISKILEIFNANTDILGIFLDSGANVNSYIHCVEYKIEENEKINLLMFSIMTENMSLFELVLRYNPDVLQEDKNKKNSLFYYIGLKDDPKLLIELIKLNPNSINTTYHDPENNLTHNLLSFAGYKNKKNLCSVLLEYNCDINYQIPESGDTLLHLVVKNDNLELAKLIYKNNKIDKSIKNKDGKTAKDLGEERRGNIYFQIISKESNNNINFNTNSNIKVGKKKDIEIFNKIAESLNLDYNEFENDNENEKNYYYENISQENIIVPIEFKNVDYTTYLSMGQDMKLCLNLFKDEEYLLKEKERLQKQLEDYRIKLEKKQITKAEKEQELLALKQDFKEYELKIIEKKENIRKIKSELKTIDEKNFLYKKLLENINQQNNKNNLNNNEINTQNNLDENNINNNPDNIDNIDNNKINLDKNGNLEPHFIQGNTLVTEEEFQFLKEKFDSKPYDRNYIVQCLQKDLEDYQQYIQSEIEVKLKKIEDIKAQLQSVVNEVDPNYKVNLYGSYSTGLCLPWSDIDTVITSKDGHYDSNFLNRLNIKLSTKEWVKDQTFLDRATIPIIKLISKDEFNFHIDISLSSENHFGLKTVSLVKEYLKAYKVLKPIILALKTLLKNGCLNDPYKGGLSSYGLILMVVSFIQSEIDNDKYNENSPTILGETFFNVLGHYGIFFDYTNYVIITYPVNDKSDSNEKDNTYQFIPNTHELIIVDPLNKQNNVAKSTFQFMNIKMGFLIAFMVAKEDCECGCHYEILKNKREENHGHCILKRIFNSIKRFKDANKNIY